MAFDPITGAGVPEDSVTGQPAIPLYTDGAAHVAAAGGGSKLNGLDDAAFGAISYTDTSVNTALSSLISGLVAGDTIRIYAPTDVYINFASDALETPPASSASMYFAAGTEKIGIPDSATHINVVRVTSNGTLNVAKVT